MIALSIHRPSVAPWLYAGLVIYFIDRIARTWRIFWTHSVKKVVDKDIDESDSVGLVEALSDDTIRVQVKTTLNWIPGGVLFSSLDCLC